MLKLILVRGLLAILVVVTGAVVYFAIAGADVTVSAPGCGHVSPPTLVSLAWSSTADGGVAKVPPVSVTVDTRPQSGGEQFTVSGPAGLSASFTTGSNVRSVTVDGALLFQRASRTTTSMTVDLGKTKHHYVLAACG